MKVGIGVALERLLGLAFLVPAVLKALDMEGFAVQIAKYHVLSDHGTIRLAAWGTLALEALVGAMLLLPTTRRLASHGLALGMLAVFSGLIAYAWAFHGLTECGCFGGYLAMGPGASILKNVAMAAVSVGALALIRGGDPAGAPRNSLGWIAAIAGCLVVAGAAAGSRPASPPPPAVAAAPAEDAPRFARLVFDTGAETIDLGSGEYFVAFYSATCEHCMSTVPAANELASQPDLPPVVAVMMGTEEEIAAFRNSTQPDFPTVGLSDKLVFYDYQVGSAPPSFYYISDGKEVAQWANTPPTAEEMFSLVGGA